MIGIDLGTTNSCVAVRRAFGEVDALAVATGPRPPYDTVLRTAVLNPQGDRPAVGQEAVNRAELITDDAQDRYLVSFKPYLDEQRLRTRVPVQVHVGWIFDPMLDCMIEKTATQTMWLGGQYTRDEVIGASTHVLSHLLQQAAADGDDLREIWLGTPVSFSSCARKRLIAALAGAWDRDGRPIFSGYRDVLARVRFVLEPVAVAAGALRDALHVADRENVLVFDHGGGTLDLSLIAFERRPEFEHPVPVRELSALGSSKVAGQALDLHFRESLDRLPAFAKATSGLRPHRVNAFVEQCKQELSSELTGEAWPGVEVDRATFETAVAPVLDEIERLLRTAVDLAELQPSEIDRVVMTGGSSLIPAVRRRVAAVFSQLDEYRLLRYDPRDRGGVERAITEVARGLVDFGDRVATQSFFQQVTLWDLMVTEGGQAGMRRVLDRGTAYKRDREGNPALRLRIPLRPTREGATSVGLYEDQLGPRFMFGLADLPPLPQGGELRVTLRPDALLPGMDVVGPDGRVVLREVRDSPNAAERRGAADVSAMGEERLAAYFAEDADYDPVNGFRLFRSAPLVRPLRMGDLVEWCSVGNGGGRSHRFERYRGEIKKIKDIATGQPVDAMSSLELRDYVFTISEAGTATARKVRGECGAIRLSPHPWKDT